MKHDATIDPAATEPAATRLRCMEIWGGNQAFDNAISVSGLSAWIHSAPFKGDRQGGDVYYISTCGHGRIARFAVADVAGHGAAVGEMGDHLRKLMRRYMNVLNQVRFARALNRKFTALASMGTFATALLTSYFAPTDDLVVCNAGHPPPLWYRARLKRWSYLDPHTAEPSDNPLNLPLGIIEPTSYQQFAVRLEKDDLVIIYSDALIEAADDHGVLLGAAGLLKLVEAVDVSDPGAILGQILTRLNHYRSGRPPADDETLIVLHHNAQDPPRLSVGEYLTVVGKALHIVPV